MPLALLWLIACVDRAAAVRQRLATYDDVVVVAQDDGSFDFSGIQNGRCAGTARVWAHKEVDVDARCVRMAQKLPPSSPLQPLAVACDDGDPNACVTLGKELDATDVSWKLGYNTMKDLFVYGCDRGVAAGCTGAGKVLMTYRNSEFKRDNQIVLANRYFVTACAAGDLDGCLEKAVVRRIGLPSHGADPAGALADLTSLCFGTLPRSCALVSDALRQSPVDGLPHSVIGADAVDFVACVRGEDARCERLLLDRSSGTSSAWVDEAYRRHCADREPDAACLLARFVK